MCILDTVVSSFYLTGYLKWLTKSIVNVVFITSQSLDHPVLHCLGSNL